MNPFKMAKVFNGVPKWRNFAKSGHTGRFVCRKGRMYLNTNISVQSCI